MSEYTRGSWSDGVKSYSTGSSDIGGSSPVRNVHLQSPDHKASDSHTAHSSPSLQYSSKDDQRRNGRYGEVPYSVLLGAKT